MLLHSGRDDDGLGTRSFVAADPSATLIARGRSLVRLDRLGHEVARGGVIDWVRADARARELLERVGLRERPGTAVKHRPVDLAEHARFASGLQDIPPNRR